MKITTKIKKGVAIALFSLTLVISSATSYAKMFGKSYDSSRDYSCCVGDQLYIFHHYTTHFFWIRTGSGYESEPIGNPSPGGCNIQCPPENDITVGL